VARVATRIARQQAGKAAGLAARKADHQRSTATAAFGNGSFGTAANPMNVVFVSAEVAPW
jgi:hypothetical protein